MRRKYRTSRFALVPGLALGFLLLSFNAGAGELTPFKVKYDVKVSVAKATLWLTLAADPPGGCTIDLRTEARGEKTVYTGTLAELEQ